MPPSKKKRKIQHFSDEKKGGMKGGHPQAVEANVAIPDPDTAGNLAEELPNLTSTENASNNDDALNGDSIGNIKSNKIELGSLVPSHLSFLLGKHDFIYVSVISSSKMKSKVTSILTHLSSKENRGDRPKSRVVVVRSRATTANKMISIVELVKQELTKDKVKVYQYSYLEGIKVSLPPKQKSTSTSHPKDPLEDVQTNIPARDDESDDSYEAPGLPHNEEPSPPPAGEKIRNTPQLTIYLCTNSLPDLKGLCGMEQTND